MPKHKTNSKQINKLNGKVALITGGAKRIGACMAKTLHGAGMNIVIHYHASGQAARALQEELNNDREQSCILIQGDLSQFNKLKSLVDESARQMDRRPANCSATVGSPKSAHLSHSFLKIWRPDNWTCPGTLHPSICSCTLYTSHHTFA